MKLKTVEIRPDMVQIMADDPYCNDINEAAMYLGKYNNCDIFRILIKLPLELDLQGRTVVEAKLNIKIKTRKSYHPDIFTINVIEESWRENCVNWINQPSFYCDIFNSGIYITKSHTYSFDITDIVRKWNNNEVPNYGLMLKNSESKNSSMVIVKNTNLPLVTITYVEDCNECGTKFMQSVQYLEVGNGVTF